MMAQMTAQEAVANNLANANTAGYKRDIPSFGTTLSGLTGAAPTASVQANTGFDNTQGAMQETGNPFQVALSGDGFFAVQTQNGVGYTRDGSFAASPDGYLVTANGDRVLGNSGPIRITGTSFQVDGQGQITQDGVQTDKLQIVSFGGTQGMAKIGDNLWSAGTAVPQRVSTAEVHQGYLEGSNVNTVREMVSMITGLRGYEANQKAIQSQDETLDKLVNDVGRVG
jgi:flagellar basal-body rod protein FlgG